MRLRHLKDYDRNRRKVSELFPTSDRSTRSYDVCSGTYLFCWLRISKLPRTHHKRVRVVALANWGDNGRGCLDCTGVFINRLEDCHETEDKGVEPLQV